MKILVHIFVLVFSLFSLLLRGEESQNAGNNENQKKDSAKNVVIKYDPEDKEISEFIPLKALDYATVEQFCRPMLSQTGSMGFMPEKNCVVVHDKKRNALKIREFIESAAKQLPDDNVNIRVEVEFKGAKSRRKAGAEIDVIYPENSGQGKIIIRDGRVQKPESIDIHVRDNTMTGSSNTNQFIMVKSGFPARIWAGKTIPDPSWLRNSRFIPLTMISSKSGNTVVIPGNSPDIVWTNVGAYLYVLPKYLGDGLIDVEIFPAVSYLDGKKRRQTVRLESVSTKLTVKSGQKINIGGIVSGKDDTYKSLFGPNFIGIDEDSSLLDMWLKATVVEPTTK